MCHYVTAVLPKHADHDHLDGIARKHGRQFRRLSNPSIEAQIEPDEQYFITTVGHCDCGTPLGALAQGSTGAPDWLVLEQRLLKRGWSKAKVARSIAQKQDDFLTAAASSASTNLKEVASWLDFIGAVLGSGRTSHLGLLLHMYSGSIESRIELAGREVVRASGLTADVLGNMKEDVLYVFRH
ncbi:hypothetical protein HIV01_009530 [Lysobacter arenosi]|uniref:Uncharacterized protein n=1 Tax=Lysobacter arenosi TaxID=2795387 RepID=A0ABX7R5W5_9GAMM|nr:hypothetical protein [Lysobacter arenosi]QSX73505.1 hypothetical protein HIV01_009530 [Lysobacter arenosi]